MSRVAMILGFAVLTVARQAYAFCVPGDTRSCLLNGKTGTQVCGSNGQYGQCIVPADPPPPSGTATAKYKVLTVIYAPPGKTGGGSASAVSYGAGSSAGTTSSSKNGFKQSYALTATVSGGVLGTDTSIGATFGYARNTVDQTAEEIEKTATTTIAQGGPAADGIDHNRDQIWLWLKPKMIVTMPTSSSITWTIAPSQVMNTQFVFVGHLKDPSLMPPGVKAQLDAAGLTTADYAEILEADPFANGDIAIDPARYTSLNTTFPYEPPFAPGDPSSTLSFEATRTVTSTQTTTTTNDYTVGLTVSGSVSFVNLFKASLKSENSWTWTDESERSSAIGSSESASVTIGGPSFGYTGSTDVGVYYDLLYKTFVFKFVPPSLVQSAALEGLVVSSSNAPVAGKEVAVVADGTTYRTFTNSVGEFRIIGVKGASTQLRVDGVVKAIPSSSATLVVNVP